MELKLNSNNMEDVQGITIEYPYVLHRDEYDKNEILNLISFKKMMKTKRS